MVNVTKLFLLATAWAGAVLASNIVTDSVRTIAGELVTVAAESDLDGDGQTAENVVLTEGGGIGFAVEIMKKSEAKPALYEPTSAPGKSNQGKDSETNSGGSRANGSLALYNPDCGNYRKTRGYPCRKDEGSPCGKCGG